MNNFTNIMDKVTFHKFSVIHEILRAFGQILPFLPFNSLQLKLKKNSLANRNTTSAPNFNTAQELYIPILSACETITAENSINFFGFQGCGMRYEEFKQIQFGNLLVQK